QVDAAALRETAEALALMRSDQAILEVGRLDGIPVRTEESREVSSRIARIVFDRVGPERTLTEPELNAAIAMFAKDVALVRRDALPPGPRVTGVSRRDACESGGSGGSGTGGR